MADNAQGVKYGGRPEWEALRNVYLKPSNPSAKISAMYGMGSTRDPALVEATLQFIVDSVQDQVRRARQWSRRTNV
jgi:aminopeptidase 2